MKKQISKKNCWEVKKCGRELGGRNTNGNGACPSSTETGLDGVHGGENAGRACWVVAGSMCDSKIQGNFAQKYLDCNICDFYMKVKSEELHNFQFSITLLPRLKNGLE